MKSLNRIAMEHADRNYGQFWSLLRRLPGADKESLVLQYTCGRTSRLSETTAKEYAALCAGMARVSGADAERAKWLADRKKRRSVCLHLMQRLGVDTSDWVCVNNFCEHPRIAGKSFRWLGPEELSLLAKKLRAIERHGGLRTRRSGSCGAVTLLMGSSPMGEA